MIGQRMKTKTQNFFTSVPLSVRRSPTSRCSRRDRVRGDLVLLRRLGGCRPLLVRQAHRVVDEIPNLLVLQGRAEGRHRRSLDARVNPSVNVERPATAAIDARRQVAGLDRMVPHVEQPRLARISSSCRGSAGNPRSAGRSPSPPGRGTARTWRCRRGRACGRARAIRDCRASAISWGRRARRAVRPRSTK